MKTQNARKIIAIFTTLSLAFLQAAPAGFAAHAPVDQQAAQSVPKQAEKSVEDVSAQPQAQQVKPKTSTDFLSEKSPIAVAQKTTNVKTASKQSDATKDPQVTTYVDPQVTTYIDPQVITYIDSQDLQIEYVVENPEADVDYYVSDIVTYTTVAAMTTYVTHKVPAEVETYVEKLRNAMKKQGYSVSMEYLKDSVPPRYKISVEAKDAKKLEKGQLKSVTFNLSEKGKLIFKSLKATYRGMGEIDAKLLFKALRQIHPKASGRGVLSLMSQVKLDPVDADGAIHFKEGNNFYKAYRDGEGKVIVEKKLPPAVQAYVDSLQEKYGDGFKIEAEADDENFVVHAYIPNDQSGETGRLKAFHFILNADGSFAGMREIVFFGFPSQGGTVLLEGLKLLQPGVSDQDALVLFTQVGITYVTPHHWDGPINFVYAGKQYKVYRDTDGNIQLLEENKLILPFEIYASAQANLSEADLVQLNQAMLDVGPNTQYSLQTDVNNDSKSWIWTSADGKTTYKLINAKVKIRQSDETIQTIDKWSFEASSVVTKVDVEAVGAQLLIPEARAQFEQALASTNASTVFTRTVSGTDTVYSWTDAENLAVSYQLWTGIVSVMNEDGTVTQRQETNFSKSERIGPVGLDQYAQNLTDPAQRAQFEAAMQDVMPNVALNHWISGDGVTESWSWKSADGKTVYALNKNTNTMVPVGMPDVNGNYPSFQTEIHWSFEASSTVTKSELEQFVSQLSADSLVHFTEALAQTDASTVFAKFMIGKDTFFQWSDNLEPLKLYSLSLYQGPDGATHVSFSTTVPVARENIVVPSLVATTVLFGGTPLLGLEHLKVTLKDLAQRAQFLESVRDCVWSLTSEDLLHILTVTRDSNGRINSWSWTSAGDPNKKYILSRDVINGMEYFNFAIQEQISSVDPDLTLQTVEVPGGKVVDPLVEVKPPVKYLGPPIKVAPFVEVKQAPEASQDLKPFSSTPQKNIKVLSKKIQTEKRK